MSSQKHALIVDDSKSARVIMRRMLEKYSLTVDTTNSAEEALDYLTHNRPDIIFMDHMMPGMDGFDAVKAIKRNPATATIPILMYTTKSGDLYLGQARALGAVGVLPKTVAPAELFEALRRLGLVPERRTEAAGDNEETASERAQDIEQREVDAAYDVDMPIDVRTAAPDEFNNRIRKLLDAQRVELRKDILVSMESVSKHVRAKFEQELDTRLGVIDERLAAAPKPSAAPTVLLGILLFASLAWNYSLHRDFEDLESRPYRNGAALERPQQPVHPESARLSETRTAAMDWTLVDWALNQNLYYPYSELALDKTRLDHLDALLNKLAANGFQGKVVLQTHAGEFCLRGDVDSGYRLPAPELPLDKCDLIGNPTQPTDSTATHQSLQFANFTASSPLLTPGGPIALEIIALPRATPLVAYPVRGADTTAQAWNTVAAQNNRVIVHLEPSLSTTAARLSE